MKEIKLPVNFLLIYGLPLLVIIFSVVIALSPLLQKYPEIAIGITYDLTITAPLLFLFLSRRSTTSELRAVPFFVIGILIATQLLPENQTEHLDYIKTYLFPAVEVLILLTLGLKINKGIKTFKTHADGEADFYEISRKSSQELFGPTKFASFFSSEITMMYYALIAWRKEKYAQITFTNYKENAGIALAMALLMVIFIETYAFHVLLLKWRLTAAWILTATSAYTAFMVIAHIKSLIISPSVLTKKELLLKNGLIARAKIDLKNIDDVVLCSKEIKSTNAMKVSNLGLHKDSVNHTMAIYFNNEQRIEKAYGFEEKCDVLLFHMDDKSNFMHQLQSNIEQHKNSKTTK